MAALATILVQHAQGAPVSRLILSLLRLTSALQDDEPEPPALAAPVPLSVNATPTLDPEATPRPGDAVPADEADLAVVEDSDLGKAIAKQLKEAYMPLELWYLRTAIERVRRRVRF